MAMVNEAKIEMDLARKILLQHQGRPHFSQLNLLAGGTGANSVNGRHARRRLLRHWSQRQS
jgi:hypothetical protein